MDKHADRRKLYKSPPTGPKQSQESRRLQALEEQKRKRLQLVDASRQLDKFAGLNLGVSDDEDEDDAQFSSSLPVPDVNPPPESRSPSPYIEHEETKPKAKKKRKGKSKSKSKKRPSKWANKCMYAELLEMREDTPWTGSWDAGDTVQHDGLPDDLETAWVGLAPIPVGKRCLAVTMQSAGVSGIVPNTILRSRLLGKVLIGPFPSPLPPNTILDCVLDSRWRLNGILHVLDVVRWKNQDVGNCEASFRFWWRDTRLSELPVWPAPPPHKSSFSDTTHATYHFPYPTTFAPVPYTAPTSLEQILGELLSRARNGQTMRLKIPMLSSSTDMTGNEGEMQIDTLPGHDAWRGFWSAGRMQDVDEPIASDGLLLYVGEAAYESGESPLSVWVPRAPVDAAGSRIGTKDSALDIFERLIRRRLSVRQSGLAVEVDMDGSSSIT